MSCRVLTDQAIRIKRQPHDVIIEPTLPQEDAGWVAWVPDLPAYGTTSADTMGGAYLAIMEMVEA